MNCEVGWSFNLVGKMMNRKLCFIILKLGYELCSYIYFFSVESLEKMPWTHFLDKSLLYIVIYDFLWQVAIVILSHVAYVECDMQTANDDATHKIVVFFLIIISYFLNCFLFNNILKYVLVFKIDF
jgi:hypothetical protein